ncbi:MAG: response regulator [Armatimonadetes bacterium]|nr:response regulator [Armatimonadota bacterium]MBS1710642.1 response regulator [Armatimonadota bacterium]MBX3108313.1 response regulator [Fimbriimonadaceae bacterium]
MRVLIADDDPIIRLDLRQMLETLGYQVVAEAEDGLAAVSLTKSESPDVCLLDVKMPSLDGIDAAGQIAEEGLAPTVLLTAYSDSELIERAKEAGVFGYLVKPFKPSDLGPAIEVARSRFESNQILNREISDLTERLEARRAIEKAKGILMKDQGLDESEAYRRIQTQSMNARKSMREVAEAIILASEV